MTDINVLAAQQWVNATYQSAPGYIRCPEDGLTGWATVLSLTQALQFELGITPTVQNFGPGTFNAVKKRNTLPLAEANANLVRIYNAGLWCKGYWASSDLGVWSTQSQSSLAQLFSDAGIAYGYQGWPHICKALLRMDQFRLVGNGDLTVQKLQQRLNSRYTVGLSIPAMSLVPCDGIPSRDLQNALLMAVQYEIGVDINAINGYFGPGTQAGLKAKGSVVPLPADLRYLFRSACYLNSPVPPGVTYQPVDIETGDETASHLAWLRAFQQFTQIPQTATNDFVTWAELLISTGDAARPGTACDGITEITAERGQALYAAGYRIVGRYLDEHLPPTDPYYLGKALKPGEPRTILDAGLRLFPIFQYNGTVLANFTYDKGYDQGAVAHNRSVEHGLPAGTCIYFAVDYDALDADVDSAIKPYFQGVKAALAAAGNRYTFGVYGARNVCTRISREVGATWSLVAAMSWQYSGNLGVRMPENWAFDQIREYNFQTGWGLDHNVWRDGGDPGVSTLDEPTPEA
jgi:peptidoglycan hydrolase-like protein with peptidoglycan-binding domain